MNEIEQQSSDVYLQSFKLIAKHQELCLQRGWRSDWANLRRSLEAHHKLIAIAHMGSQIVTTPAVRLGMN